MLHQSIAFPIAIIQYLVIGIGAFVWSWSIFSTGALKDITLPPRLSNKWKWNSSLCFKSFKENRWALKFTGSWILHYLNNPCMVSLVPTFTIKNTPNVVVKYTLHGWYGLFLIIRSKYYSVIVASILDTKNLYLRSWTLAHSGVHEGEVWVHFIKMNRLPSLKLTTKAQSKPLKIGGNVGKEHESSSLPTTHFQK